MKKGTVLLMCALGLAAFCSCKSKAKTAAEMAKAHHEKLMNQDYRGYVDAIYVDEFLLPVDVTPPQKKEHLQKHAQVLQQKAQPILESKGGMKSVAVKSETVAPDKKTADVVLTNTYHNGDTEDVVYAMVFDEPMQEWKVRMRDDKEVWKTILPDGTHESFKIKEPDNREILKFHEGSERDFLKEIETDNREVEKVKIDGEKTVHKEIEHENSTVIKDKVDGEREVTRIPKE